MTRCGCEKLSQLREMPKKTQCVTSKRTRSCWNSAHSLAGIGMIPRG